MKLSLSDHHKELLQNHINNSFTSFKALGASVFLISFIIQSLIIKPKKLFGKVYFFKKKSSNLLLNFMEQC